MHRDADLAVAAPAAPHAPLEFADRRLGAHQRDRRADADRRRMAAALPALAAGREPKQIRRRQLAAQPHLAVRADVVGVGHAGPLLPCRM
jgi:hypothetical protein